MRTKKSNSTVEVTPMLKTAEAMAKISGIGVNTLRRLMDEGKLAYIQIGNRRLIADEAIWEYYHTNKIYPLGQCRKGA